MSGIKENPSKGAYETRLKSIFEEKIVGLFSK